jgi:hypothetical protein
MTYRTPKQKVGEGAAHGLNDDTQPTLSQDWQIMARGFQYTIGRLKHRRVGGGHLLSLHQGLAGRVCTSTERLVMTSHHGSYEDKRYQCGLGACAIYNRFVRCARLDRVLLADLLILDRGGSEGCGMALRRRSDSLVETKATTIA